MSYYQSKNAPQSYIKTMPLVLLRSGEDISKVIKPSIFPQNSFYTHELQKNGEIDVKQIRSSDNLADLFTKSLPAATFKKIVHNIGMCRFKDL